jgi:hypothetical protein
MSAAETALLLSIGATRSGRRLQAWSTGRRPADDSFCPRTVVEVYLSFGDRAALRVLPSVWRQAGVADIYTGGVR